MPIILVYTGYAYWVFRGKTGARGLSLMRRPPRRASWLWFVALWAGGVGVTATGRLRDQVLAQVTSTPFVAAAGS